MRRTIMMVTAYDGTSYHGWQKQGNTKKTIQGVLEELIKELAGEEVEIHGSGRTDRGVHSWGQVFHFCTTIEMEPENMKTLLNQWLPEDVRILSAHEVENGFHARLSATGKTYSYTIWNAETHNVFQRNYVYQVPERLDIKKMRRAAGFLIGLHDFRSVCSNKDMEKSTVRTLCEIKIEKAGKMIKIWYTGDGFLYNMVRILTGTLIEVGIGKRKPEEMIQILEEGNREKAGFTAPPNGLCLEQVNYK